MSSKNSLFAHEQPVPSPLQLAEIEKDKLPVRQPRLQQDQEKAK